MYYDGIVLKGALGQLLCAGLCWSEASGVPRAGNGVLAPALLAPVLSVTAESWCLVFI